METTTMPKQSEAALALRAKIKGNADEVLPDSDRYKVRFKVRSQTTGDYYLVSFDSAAGAGYWTCSCRGCIGHGDCKHLKAAGLRGRKYGKDLKTIQALGL